MDNPKTHITTDELKYRLQFHPSDSENAQEAHEVVRTVLLEAADKLVTATGAFSREQSTMVTKLEEASFWAHAAIDRSDGPSA